MVMVKIQCVSLPAILHAFSLLMTCLRNDSVLVVSYVSDLWDSMIFGKQMLDCAAAFAAIPRVSYEKVPTVEFEYGSESLSKD